MSKSANKTAFPKPSTNMRAGINLPIIFIVRNYMKRRFWQKTICQHPLLGGMVKMRFMRRSGHFILFPEIVLVNWSPYPQWVWWGGVNKNDFSLKIWTFHAIFSKKVNWPQQHSAWWLGVLGNISFLHRSAHVMTFPQNIFNELTPSVNWTPAFIGMCTTVLYISGYLMQFQAKKKKKHF